MTYVKASLVGTFHWLDICLVHFLWLLLEQNQVAWAVVGTAQRQILGSWSCSRGICALTQGLHRLCSEVISWFVLEALQGF